MKDDRTVEPAPKKRFQLEKVEERIAPRKFRIEKLEERLALSQTSSGYPGGNYSVPGGGHSKHTLSY